MHQLRLGGLSGSADARRASTTVIQRRSAMRSNTQLRRAFARSRLEGSSCLLDPARAHISWNRYGHSGADTLRRPGAPQGAYGFDPRPRHGESRTDRNDVGSAAQCLLMATNSGLDAERIPLPAPGYDVADGLVADAE